MTKKFKKRIINEMKMITYLDAIQGCVEVARGYIKETNEAEYERL